MVDQAHALYEKGFLSSVDYVNGDLPYVEVRDIYRRVASGEIVMLYVAPERFRSRSFMTALKTRLEADGMLCYFVFDEAHCVSLWGLDFRPDFLRALQFVNKQRQRSELLPFPCIMLSATITEQIYEHLDRALVPPSSGDTQQVGSDSRMDADHPQGAPEVEASGGHRG
jgi:ATP-dependent DNA helicase RecQ